MKKKRRKRRNLSEANISRIVEAVATAFEMAEQGLRPMPLEIEDMSKEGTFTGEPWETTWHFADQLLFLSMASEIRKIEARFDILTDDYEFSTALIEIPIIAHLELEVTPVDTLPSDDIRYNDIPNDVPLWRIYSVDFQEYPEETHFMLFLSVEDQTDDGEEHDNKK